MFMGFCGLVPSEHSSGERTRRGRITKAGNAHLRRQLVESAWSYRFPANLTDRIRRRQEGLARETVTRAWAAQLRRVRNEFHPHHGSLSKDVRSEAEEALRGPRPTTAVCTTTLELGIDVGSVRAIAQIGPPPAVSGLRQRLGRSGRRGEPAILRVYVAEPDVPRSTIGSLRTRLIQAVAKVKLLLEGWLEPPVPGVRHLSTLLQQVLSVIAERGGATASELHVLLCSALGAAFAGASSGEFGSILRSMGAAGVVEQASDGALLLGSAGEHLVSRHAFFAAFCSPEEYRVVGQGRDLGTLPVLRPLGRGEPLLFAGRRWRISEVDDARRLDALGRGGQAAPLTFRVRAPQGARSTNRQGISASSSRW